MKNIVPVGFFFVPFLLFLVSPSVSAQVIIRERITISPEAGRQPSQQLSGQTDPCLIPPSSGYGAFFLTMGGHITLRPAFPGTMELGGTVVLTGPRGVIYEGTAGSQFYGKTFSVGTFEPGASVWFTIQFRRSDGKVLTGVNPEASSAYGTLGSKATGGSYIFQGFDKVYVGSRFGYSLFVTLASDLSTARDLRPASGPPREPCPIIAPFSGNIIARFNSNSYAGNQIQFESKNDTFRVVQQLFGHAINFGNIEAGDSILLPLISGSPELFGEKTYPRYEVWTMTSALARWYLEYEDWIDSDFLDFFTYAWIAPAKYSVTFDKESASPGDTVRIFIESIGFSENPSQPMTINIIEGRGMAVLQDTLGNMLGVDIWEREYGKVTKELRLVISAPSPPPVLTVAAGGAGVQNTTDPSRIIVQVFDAWDERKSGRGVVGMGTKKQLRIVEHAPWTIWPHLPPQGNGRSRGADRPGYDPKRSFTIEVLDGSGQPLADEIVQIKAEFVPFTGGHEHNNPPLLQTHQGTFYGQEKNGNPLVGLVTDPDGIVLIDSLVASQVAGRYLVTASLKADSTVRDTVQLTVRVPGLELLPDIDPVYQKIGGTSKHLGPPISSTDNNHWATQEVVVSLQELASVWVQMFPQEAKLMINDISLPSGGLFDIAGQWQPEHSTHREGRDVDVRTAFPGLRMGIKVRNDEGKWLGNRAFEDLAKANGAKKAEGHKKGTEQEHYHLSY